jgi:acetyl esterase/lipase
VGRLRGRAPGGHGGYDGHGQRPAATRYSRRGRLVSHHRPGEPPGGRGGSRGEPHNTADARETALLGGLIKDLPDAGNASPVTHVSQAAASFFLAHGTADVMVPYAQSLRLRDVLRAAGKGVSLHTVEGADHMWKGATDEQFHRLLDATLAFLNRENSG